MRLLAFQFLALIGGACAVASCKAYAEGNLLLSAFLTSLWAWFTYASWEVAHDRR